MKINGCYPETKISGIMIYRNFGDTDIKLSADISITTGDIKEIDSLPADYLNTGSRYSENFARQVDNQ